MPATLEFPETITPTKEEADSAVESSLCLAQFSGSSRSKAKTKPRVTLSVQSNGHAEDLVPIPLPAFQLLTEILTEMAKGNAVTFIPIHAELTTQQAAKILNVSRPFLIGLIDSGKLHCNMVGRHRRIKFEDLINFKRGIDEERHRVLDELAAEAQELNPDY